MQLGKNPQSGHAAEFLKILEAEIIPFVDRDIDPRRSQVVELRFFGGLGVEETAEVLNVSRHTVMRDWTLARTWLLRQLRRTNPSQ